MKFIYTDHAKKKIANRKISKKIIKEALKNPDVVLDGLFGRRIVHKHTKGKLLRIIYMQENNTYTIITAYYTEPERYEVEK